MRETLIRTVLLALALANQILSVYGLSPLPVEEELGQLLSLGFTVVTAIIAWWKNNSFTTEARTGDALMHLLKRERDEN